MKGPIQNACRSFFTNNPASRSVQQLFRSGIAAGALLLTIPAVAQNLVAKSDDAGVRQIFSIIVTAPRTEVRVLPPQIELSGEALIESQPTSIADVLRGLPGVSAKTNSRGETIARVRGAEERQTAVFFDGAPLGVPWDGRVDLVVLPAGLVSRVLVTKGAVPIEFGANAVAGVVDLESRHAKATSATGNDYSAQAEAGALGFVSGSGVGTFVKDRFDVTLAAGYITRDAEPVADLGTLPYSQTSSNRRTNSDLDSRSIFAAVGARFGVVQTRFSVLHNETKRGIAPESDRDPALAAPRFWRYPDITLTQANFNAKVELGNDTTLTGVLYRQWFDQTIDSYRTVSYSTLASREVDDDNTLGGRLTLTNKLGPVNLRWSGSMQTANHKQVDTPFPSGIAGPRLEFEQQLSSFGVEADIPVTMESRLTLSAAHDRAEMPLTGDKPAQSDQQAPAFSAAFRQNFGDDLTLTFSAGRRTRFATARELFGEALGRFLINPDLKPEQAWLTDAELTWVRPAFSLTLNPFYIRGKDTISQRIVRVGSASLRQRFNLGGTTTYGIDGAFSTRLSDTVGLAIAGTVMSAKADPGDAAFRRLVQRPKYEVSAVLDYTISKRFSISGEVLRTGSAEDDSPISGRVKLPSSTEFNLRGSMAVLNFSNGADVSLTAAADNLTNAVVLPQLGLPRPGRTVRVGIRIE